MKQKVIALVLAVLLCTATVLPASADAYIPPEYSPSYDITSAHLENGTCSPLNTFLSNFVEIGLSQYGPDTSDTEVCEAVLKHLELNAKFFSDIQEETLDDGKTYMRIGEDLFEERMDRLFGVDIPASACPGYEDGTILVTAEHYGGPIQVFASVYECSWEAEGAYCVKFDAYLVNEDFSGWYRTAHQNLPAGNLTLLGKGEALIGYDGGETVDSISTSDFCLLELTLDADNIPCAGANLPYGVQETEPPTEAPTQAPTQAPTEVSTEAPAETSSEVPAVSVQPEKTFEETASSTDTGSLVLIIVLVLVIAVLALVIILLLRKKK